MWWIIAVLILASCATSPSYDKLDRLYVPTQYAVKTAIDGNEVAYVVRNNEYVACQGMIEGRKCTVQDLDEHGMRMQEMADEMGNTEEPLLEGDCLADSGYRACFDELGAITSYESPKGKWKIEYVK